jgi:hypothetical protein
LLTLLLAACSIGKPVAQPTTYVIDAGTSDPARPCLATAALTCSAIASIK